MDYWKYHAAATPLKQKFEMYLKEFKHRVGILKGTPRAAADQQQEVVGLFRTYNAGASFNFTWVDPSEPYECDWTEFNFPVAKDFVSRFKEAHAVAAFFHLNA